jgi:hypothetical protein
MCFLATNCAKRYARGIATNHYSSIISGVVSFPDMLNAFATLALLSIANSGQMVLKLGKKADLPVLISVNRQMQKINRVYLGKRS